MFVFIITYSGNIQNLASESRGEHFLFHSRLFANENISELARGLEEVECGTAEIQCIN